VKKKRIVGNNALTAEVESPPAPSESSEIRTEASAARRLVRVARHSTGTAGRTADDAFLNQESR
jgi:hypothetical protein